MGTGRGDAEKEQPGRTKYKTNQTTTTTTTTKKQQKAIYVCMLIKMQTYQVEAGTSGVQGYPWLCRKL